MNKKNSKKDFTQEDIDKIVETQANNDSAWEKPIHVRKTGDTTVELPSELAARAAFFAHLHHEKNVSEWLKRVIRERIDLETAAFNGLKRELASRRPWV